MIALAALLVLVLCLIFMLAYGARFGTGSSGRYGTWITVGGIVMIAAVIALVFLWHAPVNSAH